MMRKKETKRENRVGGAYLGSVRPRFMTGWLAGWLAGERRRINSKCLCMSTAYDGHRHGHTEQNLRFL
jgi:hypothetical protein